jgi:hypothetical protein
MKKIPKGAFGPRFRVSFYICSQSLLAKSIPAEYDIHDETYQRSMAVTDLSGPKGDVTKGITRYEMKPKF